MSASDFSYYTQGNASNGTFGGWLFSSVPDPSRIFLPCVALLASEGVQTMSVAYSNDVLLRGFPQLHEMTARRYSRIQNVLFFDPSPLCRYVNH